MRHSRHTPIRSPKAAQGGFSLIEIILVVVLIGGIVAFAASRIMGSGDNAKVKLAQSQVQVLSEKVQQYEMDTGTLPGSLQDLVAAPGGVSGWLGPYMKPNMLKDPWGTEFQYRVPGDNKPYDIISLGKDKAPGGESTSADIILQ